MSWSAWAKDGVVDGYGIEPEQVTVIPPGRDAFALAPPAEHAATPTAPVRILFVGGDLQRKGGDVLLDAFRRLRGELRRPARPRSSCTS